jgi:hypothetical protein
VERRRRALLADVLGLLAILLVLLDYFRPALLSLPTIAAGGDTQCHYPTAVYFHEHLLPRLRFHGWYPGAYLGHPLLLYYFPLPFLLMSALAPLLGMPVAFKLGTAVGVFLLPPLAYAALRLMGFRFPSPLLGAAAATVFLFLEDNPIWGGTIASTLTGEFSYTYGMGLAVLFMGLAYRSYSRGARPWAPAVVLATTALAHGYAVLWAGLSASYFLYAARRPRRALAWLLSVAGLAAALAAFWLLPLLAGWGWTTPYDDPVQGDKYVIPGAGNPPPAVPIAVVRLGDHVLAALPGEATKEAGARIKQALVGAMAPDGVRRAVIAGLADDYVQYITTPEEYGQQSYEGASTVYGKNEGTFFQEQLVDLGKRMDAGQPAPEPYAFDPSYGVTPDGAPYPAGADHGTALSQPTSTVERLGHPSFSWQGAPLGRDLPADRAFVSVQRRDRRGRWHTVDTDLGLDFVWRVDDQGRYDATWEVPLIVPTGTYRFRVTAARYALSSQPFRVVPATSVIPVLRDGAVRLTYPQPIVNVDLTARPAAANGGRVTYVLAGVRHTIRHRRGTAFAVPTGATIPARGARDRYGNASGHDVTIQQ